MRRLLPGIFLYASPSYAPESELRGVPFVIYKIVFVYLFLFICLFVLLFLFGFILVSSYYSETVRGGFRGPSERYGSMGGMRLGSADIEYKCFDLALVSSAVEAIPDTVVEVSCRYFPF